MQFGGEIVAKKAKENYGNYIIDNKAAILKRKKQIIRMKKMLLLLLLLVSILITLGFTLPTFNLSEVLVSGVVNLSEESIVSAANIKQGINIFKVKTNNIQDELESNPYILSAEVKRKYPSKITIDIVERKLAFYTQIGEGYYVIDDSGIVLEKKESIEGMELLRLEGIDEGNLQIGKPIQNIDSDQLSKFCNIYSFLKEKESFKKYSISKLEVNNFVDLRLYVNELYIKLGTTDNINNKISKAFSILESPELSGLKGYIDVSFEGNPVIYRGK